MGVGQSTSRNEVEQVVKQQISVYQSTKKSADSEMTCKISNTFDNISGCTIDVSDQQCTATSNLISLLDAVSNSDVKQQASMEAQQKAEAQVGGLGGRLFESSSASNLIAMYANFSQKVHNEYSDSVRSAAEGSIQNTIHSCTDSYVDFSGQVIDLDMATNATMNTSSVTKASQEIQIATDQASAAKVEGINPFILIAGIIGVVLVGLAALLIGPLLAKKALSGGTVMKIGGLFMVATFLMMVFVWPLGMGIGMYGDDLTLWPQTTFKPTACAAGQCVPRETPDTPLCMGTSAIEWSVQRAACIDPDGNYFGDEKLDGLSWKPMPCNYRPILRQPDGTLTYSEDDVAGTCYSGGDSSKGICIANDSSDLGLYAGQRTELSSRSGTDRIPVAYDSTACQACTVDAETGMSSCVCKFRAIPNPDYSSACDEAIHGSGNVPPECSQPPPSQIGPCVSCDLDPTKACTEGVGAAIGGGCVVGSIATPEGAKYTAGKLSQYDDLVMETLSEFNNPVHGRSALAQSYWGKKTIDQSAIFSGNMFVGGVPCQQNSDCGAQGGICDEIVLKEKREFDERIAQEKYEVMIIGITEAVAFGIGLVLVVFGSGKSVGKSDKKNA